MAKSKNRYFKRKKLKQLILMSSQAKKIRINKNDPPLYKFDKKKEMKAIFTQNRTKNRALIFDLDGTIIAFAKGKRKHCKVSFRPHFDEFMNRVSKMADVFIYSAAEIIRLENLMKNQLKGRFCGFFDRRFLSRRKKSLAWLIEIDPELIVIDDTPHMIAENSKNHFLFVNRWGGDDRDEELLRIWSIIEERWKEQA